VLDEDGLKVVDVTRPAAPRVGAGSGRAAARGARALPRTHLRLRGGRRERPRDRGRRAPEQPRLDQTFDAAGAIDDARDVKVGMTNGSAFAYVADGKNGLRVVQLISANDTPGAYGFSPRPTPSLVATYRRAGRRSRSRAASTAIARSTRRGTSSRSSAAAARGR
jgi:hypothetical protein